MFRSPSGGEAIDTEPSAAASDVRIPLRRAGLYAPPGIVARHASIVCEGCTAAREILVKKTLSAAAAAILTFMLAACVTISPPGDGTESSQQQQQTPGQQTPQTGTTQGGTDGTGAANSPTPASSGPVPEELDDPASQQQAEPGEQLRSNASSGASMDTATMYASWNRFCGTLTLTGSVRLIRPPTQEPRYPRGSLFVEHIDASAASVGMNDCLGSTLMPVSREHVWRC